MTKTQLNMYTADNRCDLKVIPRDLDAYIFQRFNIVVYSAQHDESLLKYIKYFFDPKKVMLFGKLQAVVCKCMIVRLSYWYRLICRCIKQNTVNFLNLLTRLVYILTLSIINKNRFFITILALSTEKNTYLIFSKCWKHAVFITIFFL